jgi:predicted AAA+ superfamily ATPase
LSGAVLCGHPERLRRMGGKRRVGSLEEPRFRTLDDSTTSCKICRVFMIQLTIHPRCLERTLRKTTSRGKVRLLFGARQTGKSTLLRAIAPSGAVMINLQDPRERMRYERSPGALASEIEARREKRLVVCVDEIQKVPSLLDDIQYLYDRFPARFEFFVTGSSSRRLRAGAANLLPGRAHSYHLLPVIGPERASSRKSTVLSAIKPFATAGGFPAATIEDLLVWGSLPGVSSEPVGRRASTLTTYAEVYLEEEIRREAVVRDVGAFARFLTLAAVESGRAMNLTALSQESGVPVATIRNFYQVLVDTFVGYWILPYGHSGRKEILSTPRFLFFDLGVRNAVADAPLSRALLKTYAGPLFEQWVLLELVARTTYLGRGYQVQFWRTRHGAEVDAVVATPRRDIPIEVKWTENPRPADARHLELFLDSYTARAKRGFLVCRVPRAMKLTDRVTAIPWQEL